MLRDMRTRLAIALLSAVIALLLCEVLARQMPVVRNIGESFSEYDPVLGKVQKRGFTALRWTPEFTMRFTTNSLGFRGPEPGSLAPSSGVLLFVGDSYTEGYGVNDGEEFPQLVARQLAELGAGNQLRVVNAGVGDTGTARALKFLRLYAERACGPAQHTFLVYQTTENDLMDNEREGFFALDATGQFVDTGTVVPQSMSWRLQPLLESIPGFSRSYLIATVLQAINTRVHTSKLNDAGNSDQEVAWKRRRLLMRRLLEEILALAEKCHWESLMLQVGVSPQEQDLVTSVAMENRVELITVPERTSRPEFYYRVDGHWNARGHQYVAEVIMPWVLVKLKAVGLGGGATLANAASAIPQPNQP
jgi:hypothetical protein